MGTLEGKLHGTEAALAKAREELARYRSMQGDLNTSRSVDISVCLNDKPRERERECVCVCVCVCQRDGELARQR